MAESVSKPHKLTIEVLDEIDPETDKPFREWHVEHDAGCPEVQEDDPFVKGKKITLYDCMVAHEIHHVNLDGLDPDWTTLEPGEYTIEAFSSYDPFTMEWDGGMRIIDA